MAVFVLDKQKRPLMPCSEKRARLLLERGRAVVVREAVRQETSVVWLAERIHRGYQISEALTARRAMRRRRTCVIQRTRLDRFGFPRGYRMRHKRIHGFQTGDRIIARVPSGKKAGVYVGRVAIRASGSFNIQTAMGLVQGISHRYCRVMQRADGYGYTIQTQPVTEEARRAA